MFWYLSLRPDLNLFEAKIAYNESFSRIIRNQCAAMKIFSERSETEDFDEEAYQKSKRGERRQAYIFLILGGLVLLDSGSPVPIPLTGLPSILLGLAIMAYGWSQWRSYQRLPLHEALQLGRLQGGRLSRTDLFLKLRLSAEKTDQLLDLLVQQGFLERVDEDLPPENEPVYRLLS